MIAIDPRISALSRLTKARVDGRPPAAKVVSAFASVECVGIETLREASDTVARFERCSGQRINKEKASIAPDRRLSEAEERDCREAWGGSPKL